MTSRLNRCRCRSMKSDSFLERVRCGLHPNRSPWLDPFWYYRAQPYVQPEFCIGELFHLIQARAALLITCYVRNESKNSYLCHLQLIQLTKNIHSNFCLVPALTHSILIHIFTYDSRQSSSGPSEISIDSATTSTIMRFTWLQTSVRPHHRTA